MTYEITVSPRQQAVLRWLIAQTNAERGTTLTIAEFLQGQFGQLLQPYDVRFDEWEADEVKKRFKAANDTTRDSIKTSLGM